MQRRYFAWAERHYAKMSPELATEARRIDQWMQQGGGWGVLLGLLCGLAGSVAALVGAGFPFWLALFCALVVWWGLMSAALKAWLAPQQHTAARVLRQSLVFSALGYGGAFVGFLAGRVGRQGDLNTETLADALWPAAKAAAPLLLVAVLVIMALQLSVVQARSWHDRRELARMTLEQERDSAARQAAESRLHLLQAQIQPHFVFNTLAAVQHWVDQADPRAGPLLRDLTAFLRGSTELLARGEVPLGEEAQIVQQYLRIMQARLGPRLGFTVELDAASAAWPLPAGILLTLVENAVEHGITPALQGGAVRVRAQVQEGGLLLQVQDSGVGLAGAVTEGLGLSNSRERLRHRYGSRASLALAPLQPGACARLEIGAA